jgi:hypothetical protein
MLQNQEFWKSKTYDEEMRRQKRKEREAQIANYVMITVFVSATTAVLLGHLVS